MGTIYRSICGCLTSAPEPCPSEYDWVHDWGAAWQEWDRAWTQAVQNHKASACLNLPCVSLFSRPASSPMELNVGARQEAPT